MKSKNLLIHKKSQLDDVKVQLVASKSISNRALIVNQLASEPGTISNLSEARDTQTMQRLLNSDDHTLDVLDAGTTMRFLTAFLTITNEERIITGTPRMRERPIKILVEALREIGGNIDYLQKEGYPPLHIKGLKKQINNAVSLRGDVSSQYISAMLMIGPLLPQGLSLHLVGKVGSRPYIDMTLKVMETFGVNSEWHGNTIIIAPQKYQATSMTVEPDWSGASYWYSFIALSNSGSVSIADLRDKSLQGDRAIADIMSKLGVQTEFTNKGAVLSKSFHQDNVDIDFSNCPDLAQTVAVVCAAKGIYCTMRGLESLKIKETDRIEALKKELAKIDADLNEDSGQWLLKPSSSLPDHVFINTYDDHRMAMAFAPLSCLMDVTIEDYSVVNKSFPTFWQVMEEAGFSLKKPTSAEN